MKILKCKACGGDLKLINPSTNLYECIFCSSRCIIEDETTAQNNANKAQVMALVDRARDAIDDDDIAEAQACLSNALRLDPKCGAAYELLLCIEFNEKSVRGIFKDVSRIEQIQSSKNYTRAVTYGRKHLSNLLMALIDKKSDEDSKADISDVRLKPLRDKASILKNFIVAGRHCTIAIKSDGRLLFAGSPCFFTNATSSAPLELKTWSNVMTIHDGFDCIFALDREGEILCQKRLTGSFKPIFSNMKYVASLGGSLPLIGVKGDGTVISSEDASSSEKAAFAKIRGAKKVLCDGGGSIFLLNDGSVYAVHKNSSQLNTWTDIVDIISANDLILGLRKDGSVVYIKPSDDLTYDFSGWDNIVKIYAAPAYVAGLKKGGRVVITGKLPEMHNNVSTWTDIVDIACAYRGCIGLKSNGTLVSSSRFEFPEISTWTNVVAIQASGHVVALREDGTVLADGNNDKKQCELRSFKIFNSADGKIKDLNIQLNRARDDLKNIDGFFVAKKKARKEAEILMLENILQI